MKFKTEDIISSATGCLIGKMDGVYEVLSFMVGESLYTHQLPGAIGVAKETIYKQCPWLNDIDVSGINPDNVFKWRDEVLAKLDSEYELTPMEGNPWEGHDPIEDLIKMRGGKEDGILVVEV